MSYIETFQRAKTHFKVIGVLSMAHAGMNTFCTQLWQRKLLLMRGSAEDSMRSSMTRLIAQGDQWVQLHAHDKGIRWTTTEAGDVEIDVQSFVNSMMNNHEFYEKFAEHSFETRMATQLYRMNVLCDQYSGLSSALGIPMFVDLPMSAAINNYNDLVHEILVIGRSRSITTESWYYNHFVESVGVFTEQHTVSDRMAFLERLDKYFDKLRKKPTHVIENNGLIGDYMTKIDDYLMDKVFVAVQALEKEKMIVA